jgi:large subunit ribosomal protein L10
MATEEKSKVIDEIRDKIKRAQSIFFVDFTGVAANDFNELRRRARERNLMVKVVKNTLALRALQECGVPASIAEILRGPTSLIFSSEDPVAPARLLKEAKENVPGIKFKGAYLEKAIYSAAQFELLAALPTKEDVRAQLVGVLSSPLSGLVGVLEGLLGELVWALEEIARRPQPGAKPEVATGE